MIDFSIIDFEDLHEKLLEHFGYRNEISGNEMNKFMLNYFKSNFTKDIVRLLFILEDLGIIDSEYRVKQIND